MYLKTLAMYFFTIIFQFMQKESESHFNILMFTFKL